MCGERIDWAMAAAKPWRDGRQARRCLNSSANEMKKYKKSFNLHI